MQSEPQRRARLEHNIEFFRARAAELQLPLMESASAIQPLPLGCEKTVMAVAAELLRCGFLVGAIRPPTVPAGTARLRITLNASHREEQIEQLLCALAETMAVTSTVAS